MSREEALGILAHMAAAWPWPVLTDEQVEVWVAHLRRLPVDTAQAAAVLVESTCDRFPSIARFQEAMRSVAQREQLRASTASTLAALGPADRNETDRERALAGIAEARQALKGRS